MAIVHIVLFQFKPTCTVTTIQDICQRMLALKELCIHPTTNRPYIQNLMGGRNNSLEGLEVGGTSHAFISFFDTEEDRKYYLEQDPQHLAFIESLAGIVQRVRVVDFTPGVL